MSTGRPGLLPAERGRLPASHFRIADIPFTLEAPCGLEELGLRARYAPFLCKAPEEPATRLRWREGDPDRVPQGEMLFDPGEIWRLARRGDGRAGYCARIRYGSRGKEGARAAVIASDDWSEVEVVERRGGPGWRSLLDVGVGELVVRMRVLLRRGLVLHASGVDDGGRALLFVGHSGAGKSTQAEIWGREEGVARMSEDRVAVRLTECGAVAYDTPWGRPDAGRPSCRAPLAALLLLEQAPCNELTRLPGAEAAPRLLSRTFLPYGDAALLAHAFSTLEQLLDLAPVYRLRCRPERAVIPLVREALCGSRTTN